MISATDPVHNDPSVPDGEAALSKMLAEPGEFSDSLPRNVFSLAARKHRRARLAGVLTLAAAAVTAGILVATNLGSLTTAPEPASTVAGLGTASSTATPTPTPTPTPTATPTPSTSASSTPKAAVGHGECTKENLTSNWEMFQKVRPVIELVGCSAGWMGMVAAAANDAPEPSPGDSFWIASLVNGTYVFDNTDPSSSISSWRQANLNNDGLTAERSMDKEFADKGIPVGLREALVGVPEAGSLAARGIKTYSYGSAGYTLAFNYPAAWRLVDSSESIALSNGPGTALKDSAGKVVAQLASGDPTDWRTSACRNNAPYKVLDSQSMPELPFDAAAPAEGTPRFVFVVMTSAADDGGPVQAGIGITNRIAGQSGIGCVLDFAVGGPDPLNAYSFTDRRPLGGPAWGLFKFQTMDEAAAFTRTQGYKDLKSVITSLTVTKVN
ncbi:hypothetical protein [Arthrobacter sp. NicSoilB8]|uniref:hypothetical protein n=1 Tax=Arthrobacter sp. NicSoilB8 TaxID=2830998 RepID=UPI001CC7E55A|nr:hypothetical protein [Arthrobacter sp. NicSoilB8]